jgi:diguanylate cyclase (GGDEF)-like protein
MHDLKAWYRQGLAARIDTLEAAALLWRERPGEALDAIRRVAHALKGSGATYGFPGISRAAQALEEATEEAIEPRLAQLLQILRETGAGMEGPAVRLLVVTDDSVLLALLREWLAAPGRELLVVGGPTAAEQILDEQAIALVLLDLSPNGNDGRRLLLRLRDRPTTALLPLLVLTSPGAGPRQDECVALGADAVFEKPVEPRALAVAVAARLRRSLEIARESRQDALTGLANRAAFRDTCERARLLTQRTRQPLSLALLDLDRFKAINDLHGHAMGDEVLRRTAVVVAQALRTSDVLARWGGEEFVVLFPNTGLGGAALALDRALQALRQECFSTAEGVPFQVTFSAGVAEYSPGTATDFVLSEADRCLYRAKAAGRNCIVRADESLPPPRKRILFAEDDAAVAKVVSDHLGRAGFDVLHFTEGTAALAAAVDARAALVLLDVKMAELDGFEVLACLRRNAYLAQVPVVMLTAMNREQDIVRGFDLGADDYIVKPFSPAELVARVRRLLRSR